MDSGSYYSSKRVEPDAQATLIMEQAEFSWQLGNDGFRLSDLNLMITKGQFIGVIGKVGSGKSSFLQAITGNLVKRNGSIYVRNWQQGFLACSVFILKPKLNVLFVRFFQSPNEYRSSDCDSRALDTTRNDSRQHFVR